MSTPKVDVASQNQKLFDLFKDKFATTRSYIPAARKLRPWLQNDKAYYLQARPQIIEILMIAENTLRASEPSVEKSHFEALAQTFIELVYSILPYQHHFEEPELLDSIQRLVQVAAHLQAPLTSVTSPSYTKPLQHQSHIAPASSSSLASALTPVVQDQGPLTVPPPPRIDEVPVPAVTFTNETLASSMQYSFPPPASMTPSQDQTEQPSEITLSDVQPQAVTVASADAAPTSKPVRRKKKKKEGLDLTKFLDADVQDYKQKIGASQKPTEKQQTVAQPVKLEASESHLENMPTVASGLTEQPTEVTPATPSLPPTVPEVVKPHSFIFHTTSPEMHAKIVDISVSVPVVFEPSQPSLLLTPAIKDVPILPLTSAALPETLTADVAGNREQDIEMSDPPSTEVPKDPILEEPSTVIEDEVNRILRTLAGSASPQPTSNADPIMANVKISNSVNHAAAECNEAIPPSSTGIELPPAVTRTHSPQLPPEVEALSIAMEDVVDIASQDHLQVQDRSSSINTTAALQALIKNVVKDVNQRIASSTASLVPSELLPSTEGAASQPEEAMAMAYGSRSLSTSPISDFVQETSKTGIQAATIIARHRGLASGTISIDFFINQLQWDSMTRWNNRWELSDNLEEALCITLLCFLVTDVKARLESPENKDLQTFLPELECSWPKTGGMSMNALWNGERKDFPMSPPFALPPNGLVDISQFLVLGQNTLHITQTRDMSNYWLVFCAHHPTPAQLSAVARKRNKEQSWSGWLRKISTQPLQLPFIYPHNSFDYHPRNVSPP